MNIKRTVILVAILFVVVSAAPVAEASHCLRCKPGGSPGTSECTVATGTLIGGFPICYVENNICYVEGTRCQPHTAALTPFEADYQIASVERLDEPRGAASETLVAAAAPTPATR